MTSGETTFFFDFDIFSMGPIFTGLPLSARFAAPLSTITSSGSSQSPLSISL